MRKLTFAVIAALALFAVAPAQGGKPMGGKMVQMGSKHAGMTVMECCMQGLSADEKTTAMAMMKKGSPAEHAAMMKRCSMCMKDPHTALMKMDHSKVTEQMKMQHMMSGMTKAEQGTMMKMMGKMSAKEKAVSEKMMMNCCMYGAKHAGHKGK
jgi:hypothetical protein